MYLFSRRARLAPGNIRAAMTWANAVTEKANQISSLDISLFSSVFSPGVGTLVWSTFAPDLASLEAATDKLAADDGYAAILDEGSKFIQPGIDDGLLQLIHGEPNPARTVEYASTVQGVCTGGNIARGMEIGVEIAQRAEKATGIPTMFASSETGPYGSVAWVSGFADVAEMEKAQKALAADSSFLKFIDDKASGVYLEEPSMSQQLIYRRIV